MKLGLIGEVLNYSKSGEIHNTYFDISNKNATYDLIELSRDELEKFMTSKIYDYDGMNVTIPYKQEVIPFLDEISNEARELNSVNTIKIEDGKLKGFNTDISGFKLSLEKFHITLDKKDVVILGTGATGKMMEYISNSLNAKSVRFVSRQEGYDFKYTDNICGDVLINTTPKGTWGKDDDSPVSESVVKNFESIIDINYNPFRTKLLRYGLYNNKKIMNGFYMLVAQGLISEGIWHNEDFFIEEINRTYEKLQKNINIVLIGLSGCGKSTVSKELCKRLNKNIISTDEKIEKDYDMSIHEMFQKSEEYFRERESKVIEKVSLLDNTIIDSGGGVIKNETNMNQLYRNGIVFYINRPVEGIISTINFASRPLVKDDGVLALKRLYEERHELYERYGEIEIINRDIEETVEKIIEKLEEI